MQIVLDHVDVCKRRLSHHRLFADLAGAASLRELLSFAPCLAGWVGAFPRVLAINARRTSAPHLRALVDRHAREEAGHDAWYFDDVERLTGRRPNADLAAADAHGPTRRATLRLTEEALSTASDAQRLVFLIALEATSEAFFSALAPLVSARGGSERLRYFGAHHLDSEHDHTLFEREVMRSLQSIALSEGERAAAIALVGRTFAAFEGLFDGLRAPRAGLSLAAGSWPKTCTASVIAR